MTLIFAGDSAAQKHILVSYYYIYVSAYRCERVCSLAQVTALQMQLSSATRRADFAEMELEELRPSLRRLSVGFDRSSMRTHVVA